MTISIWLFITKSLPKTSVRYLWYSIECDATSQLKWYRHQRKLSCHRSMFVDKVYKEMQRKTNKKIYSLGFTSDWKSLLHQKRGCWWLVRVSIVSFWFGRYWVSCFMHEKVPRLNSMTINTNCRLLDNTLSVVAYWIYLANKLVLTSVPFQHGTQRKKTKKKIESNINVVRWITR